MCVAAVIFKPVSKEYLKEMEDSNPHGGGVAWQEGGAIRFHRGLTAAEIHAMQEAGTMSYPYLLHFRWATHGARVGELTHPFPTGTRALMGELTGTAPEVLIHNGTWSDWDDAGRAHLPPELRGLLGEMSDTAIAAFIAAYNPDILDEVPWATAHAFMNKGEMDVSTRGTWSDHQGNWYSNLSWLPTNSWQYKSWPSDYGKSRYENPYRVPSFYDDDSGHAWGARNAEKGVRKEEKDPEAISWEQYVRAKYGDEAAEELNRMMAEEDPDISVSLTPEGATVAEFPARDEVDWSDLNMVSEDFGMVNEYLRKVNAG